MGSGSKLRATRAVETLAARAAETFAARAVEAHASPCSGSKLRLSPMVENERRVAMKQWQGMVHRQLLVLLHRLDPARRSSVTPPEKPELARKSSVTPC